MAGNSWYEAGEAIRSLVQDAVENQDFTQLSSTITNIVNQTVDGFQDALRESLRGQMQNGREDYAKQSRNYRKAETGQAQNYWERTADQSRNDRGNEAEQAQSFQGNGTNRTQGFQEGNYHYRAGEVRFSGQEAAERIRRNMETKKQEVRPVSRSLSVPGLMTGRVMALTGYGFGGMFGFALIITAIVGDATGGIPDFVYGILGVLTGLNLWLGIAGGRRLGLANRFRRYRRMLGDRTYCMLEELASGTGKTVSFIRKDLKKMLHKGFFPEGHLDRKETCLITDNETYRQYLLTQQEADRRSVFGDTAGRTAGNSGPNFDRAGNTGNGQGPGRFEGVGKGSDDRSGRTDDSQNSGENSGAKTDGNPRAALDRECRRLIEEGERYIAHIHECNDRIPGAEMSAKLDRLELVVTRIFREVERRPELAPELRKMMSYYLPTTQKLIDAYCQFAGQPIRGQNIDGTKQEIESALDTINLAFENLLDGFFENMAWDISSDISVLHTMFTQEGLTGGDFPKGEK